MSERQFFHFPMVAVLQTGRFLKKRRDFQIQPGEGLMEQYQSPEQHHRLLSANQCRGNGQSQAKPIGLPAVSTGASLRTRHASKNKCSRNSWHKPDQR
jgi:hypothetical protein